jgi:hypothetical protein
MDEAGVETLVKISNIERALTSTHHPEIARARWVTHEIKDMHCIEQKVLNEEK